MYKIFLVNKRGKIELTLGELQKIVDEARTEEQQRLQNICPFCNVNANKNNGVVDNTIWTDTTSGQKPIIWTTTVSVDKTDENKAED